jgi:hypothetical protein
VNGTLQVLRLEVAADARGFADRVAELSGLALTPSTDDPNLLARAAVALHHAYGAVESALARIARVFDTQPPGPNWHRALLETMAKEVPGIRPAILSASVLPSMRDLLAFRHFFRHAYSVPLDAGRLVALRLRTAEARVQVLADFERLDAWLASLASRT